MIDYPKVSATANGVDFQLTANDPSRAFSPPFAKLTATLVPRLHFPKHCFYHTPPVFGSLEQLSTARSIKSELLPGKIQPQPPRAADPASCSTRSRLPHPDKLSSENNNGSPRSGLHRESWDTGDRQGGAGCCTHVGRTEARTHAHLQ